MKFSIQRLAFLKALGDVQRAIPSKTTIPILTGVKIQASSEGLLLTASDSELSIELFLPSQEEDYRLRIEEEGAVVLPARFFNEIIKKLPEDHLTISVNQQHLATIESGNASFTLNGLSASDYPHLPEVEKNHVLTLPVPLFRQVIQQTAIATSSMESRPILTGIHLTIKDNLLKAVATDSHRLSQRIIPIEMPAASSALSFDLVIPGKTLVELAKITEGLESIDFAVTENQVLFQTPTLSFYSRLLEGAYPDTDRLINDMSNTQITVQANELVAAVERASLMAQSGSNHIATLSISQDQCILTGKSPEIGTVVEKIALEAMEGAPLEISFNPVYLKDALRLFGASLTSIRFIEANRPFTLTLSEDHSGIDHSFIQLITPVRTF